VEGVERAEAVTADTIISALLVLTAVLGVVCGVLFSRGRK
jgi:hypothetical protein